MRILVALLLLSSVARGQFLSPGLDWSAVPSHVPGPETISGLAHRWVASDLPVGGSVSNWVDRVQSFSATQSTGGNQPTNSAQGVFFDSSRPDFLNLTNMNLVTPTMSMFIVFRINARALTAFGYWTLLGGSSGSPYGLHVHQPGTFDNQIVVANPTDASLSGSAITTNAVIDFIHNEQTSIKNYTNGIDTTITADTLGLNYTFIGKDNGNNGFLRNMDGWICEIATWTNHQFSAGDITTLHNYAKAAWGVTP